MTVTLLSPASLFLEIIFKKEKADEILNIMKSAGYESVDFFEEGDLATFSFTNTIDSKLPNEALATHSYYATWHEFAHDDFQGSINCLDEDFKEAIAKYNYQHIAKVS